MRKLTCTTPGTLDYAEAAIPVRKEGETLLRIKRVGICGTDLHAFEGTQPYFTYPRVLGHEIAAVIEETDAEGFERGEPVTIIPYFNCNNCIACRSGKPNCCVQLQVCGVHIDGAMANYFSVPSYALVKNNGLSFDELALVEPLSIGAHSIRRANVQPNEFVLVVGAGPIGLGAIEFARIAGATVIVVDVQERRLAFCREQLNITHTINPQQENALARLSGITNGDMASVVIDATGNLAAINHSFGFLSHAGRYVLVGLQKETISVSHPEFHKREATLMSSRNATREDFEHVMNSLANGWVRPANYITHRAGFDEVKSQFTQWLDPANGVIKAMVYFD